MESRTRLIVIALVSVAVVLAVIFLIRGIFSIVNRKAPATSTTVSKSTNPVSVTKLTVDASNINKDPLVYDGLTVEVNSKVSDWITKKIFTLNAGTSGGIFGGSGGQLLVISDKTFPLHKTTAEQGLGLGELVNVHLIGRVRIMDRVELGRVIGIDLDNKDLQLDDNGLLSSWKEGPVLILDSVDKL